MPYKIVIDRDSQMVVLRVLGKETLDEHREICERTVQICSDSGFKKLLIDLRGLDTANIASAETGLEFGRFFAGDQRLKDVRIAQVLPTEVLARADVDFSASIAGIEGKAIERFTSIEEALRRLKEQ